MGSQGSNGLWLAISSNKIHLLLKDSVKSPKSIPNTFKGEIGEGAMCYDVFMSLSLSLSLSLPHSFLFFSPFTSLSFPGYPSSQVKLEHKWIKGELRSLRKEKPFQTSAQMKSGPAHTCAHTHPNTHSHVSATLIHSSHHTNYQLALCSRYVSIDLWMPVSVCWEGLSSPCFWACCQTQLPAVLGQGNTMVLNVVHQPPSILYQPGKKVAQRQDKDKFYRNMHR